MTAILALLTMIQPSWAGPPLPDDQKVVLAIHGGAGVLSLEIEANRERQYRDALERSLKAGHAVLSKGGTSLDAVEASILVLEDSPLFNAGKGAVFTHEGRHELDASIMDGSTRKTGAVAGVTIVKNPIKAARAVMDHSPHVLFAGPGADAFVREQKLELVENTYFDTPGRRKELEKALAAEARQNDQTRLDAPAHPAELGTVGAVALDQHGHLAAGTSTGGMTNKRFGRVGDSPIVGAGTYADDLVAISCTGHGEFFIRYSVAHEIAARVRLGHQTLSEAADGVINHTLKEAGGEGGAIALDSQGRCAQPFNTPGMFRGTITADGTVHIAIFRE